MFYNNFRESSLDAKPPRAGLKLQNFKSKLRNDINNNGLLYLLVLPVIIYYLVFCYGPMYGVLIAFKKFTMNADLNFFQNISASPWIGFKYFEDFFSSYYFSRVLINTIRISLFSLIFCFPAPIILALLINEVSFTPFKKLVQTVSYLPHFISLVVICGMIRDFTSDTGFISVLLSNITGNHPTTMLNDPGLFVPVYIISDIWQSMGWGSIIYLAALSGIDPELYEAARIDGAKRWNQTLHITLPCLMPTISIMFILRMGGILNVGYEKIILLYNPLTKPVAEVISSYTYQIGLIERNWSYSSAVGLFNSAVNLMFLFGANYLSRKLNDTGLW